MPPPPVVLIGVDVDPRLPGMRRRPAWDMWDPLDQIPAFVHALGSDLPPLTWLIRADDTIRHWSGTFDSGYTTRAALWESLRARGHELGWHFHHWTYDAIGDRFDPAPSWLEEAHCSLTRHFPVLATRTGWDFCNTETMVALDRLGIRLDFSALPGQVIWWTMEDQHFVVNWSRTLDQPYHPSSLDYQIPDSRPLTITEVPVATFRADTLSIAKRILWRGRHGNFSLTGIAAKTHLMTASWNRLPAPARVLAFHFHPEELTDNGIRAFRENLALLQREYNPRFVTATELLRSLTASSDPGEPCRA